VIGVQKNFEPHFLSGQMRLLINIAFCSSSKWHDPLLKLPFLHGDLRAFPLLRFLSRL
jgi:hypothetical protein